MTNQKPTEDHGNEASASNPKSPRDAGKVNPQTGGTTTEHTGVKPAKS